MKRNWARAVIYMLKQTIGFVLLTLGAMGGDSEKLLIPILLITIGAVLMLIGKDDGGI